MSVLVTLLFVLVLTSAGHAERHVAEQAMEDFVSAIGGESSQQSPLPPPPAPPSPGPGGTVAGQTKHELGEEQAGAVAAADVWQSALSGGGSHPFAGVSSPRPSPGDVRCSEYAARADASVKTEATLLDGGQLREVARALDPLWRAPRSCAEPRPVNRTTRLMCDDRVVLSGSGVLVSLVPPSYNCITADWMRSAPATLSIVYLNNTRYQHIAGPIAGEPYGFLEPILAPGGPYTLTAAVSTLAARNAQLLLLNSSTVPLLFGSGSPSATSGRGEGAFLDRCLPRDVLAGRAGLWLAAEPDSALVPQCERAPADPSASAVQLRVASRSGKAVGWCWTRAAPTAGAYALGAVSVSPLGPLAEVVATCALAQIWGDRSNRWESTLVGPLMLQHFSAALATHTRFDERHFVERRHVVEWRTRTNPIRLAIEAARGVTAETERWVPENYDDLWNRKLQDSWLVAKHRVEMLNLWSSDNPVDPERVKCGLAIARYAINAQMACLTRRADVLEDVPCPLAVGRLSQVEEDVIRGMMAFSVRPLFRKTTATPFYLLPADMETVRSTGKARVTLPMVDPSWDPPAPNTTAMTRELSAGFRATVHAITVIADGVTCARDSWAQLRVEVELLPPFLSREPRRYSRYIEESNTLQWGFHSAHATTFYRPKPRLQDLEFFHFSSVGCVRTRESFAPPALATLLITIANDTDCEPTFRTATGLYAAMFISAHHPRTWYPPDNVPGWFPNQLKYSNCAND